MGIIKKYLQKQTHAANKVSLAYRLRMKRMRVFESYFESVINKDSEDAQIKILDIGGTVSFWETLEFKYIKEVSITLLNLNQVDVPLELSNVESVVGDGTDLKQYGDNAYDIAFSNSVIEHVGNFEKQQMMANELKRVGKHVYLQTPNKYFPLEPHFLFPWFQILPLCARTFLVQHFQLGHMPTSKKREEAREIANSVRLLTKKELKKLFPGVEIKKEKLFIWTKSFYLFF